jgi:1-acyl-sn-glycerol-3-phosphate acyltransferase
MTRQPYLPSVIKLVLIALSTFFSVIFIIIGGFFGRHGKLAYRFSKIWMQSILKIGRVKVKVQGIEHLDTDRPYIFVANHRSHYDVPALGVALRQFQLRWTAKKELLKVPIFGWAVRASKHVIVDRGNPNHAIQSLEVAKERIAAGISIIFFPEGTRSTNGKLLRFKKGGFRLAVETGTPVVPVTINGSGRILGKSQWRIQGGQIEVVISPPILVKSYKTSEVDLLSRRARYCVERHYQD